MATVTGPTGGFKAFMGRVKARQAAKKTTSSAPSSTPSTSTSTSTSTSKPVSSQAWNTDPMLLQSQLDKSGLKPVTVTPTGSRTNYFGDVGGLTPKPVYNAEGVQLSNKSTIGLAPGQTFKPIEIPKSMQYYGQAMKQQEAITPGLLESRNDIIATNLYGAGAKTKDDIRQYLEQQKGFIEASDIDRQNTIESIAARMGITKDTLTIEDKLMADADAELLELKKEKDRSNLWKLIDNVYPDEVRQLSDAELAPLAEQVGMTIEQARSYEQERLKSLQEYKRPYDEAQFDLERQRERNMQDADISLQRAIETNMNNIADVEKETARNIQASEMVGALKGYNESQLWRQGLKSIQTDADEMLRRIRKDIQNDTDDTLRYKTRLSEDFTTSMDRLNLDFKDKMKDMRLRGSETINTLLEKYSPSEDIMTQELDKFAKEFGMRGADIMSKYVSMYKEITNDAYEKETAIANIQNIYSQIEARQAGMQAVDYKEFVVGTDQRGNEIKQTFKIDAYGNMTPISFGGGQTTITPSGQLTNVPITNYQGQQVNARVDSIAAPSLQNAVSQMVQGGAKIVFNPSEGSYRTAEQQSALYDELHGTGAVAQAGKSKHNQGLAIDIYSDAGGGKLGAPTQQMISAMNANGWFQTIEGDSGHFEYQGAQQMSGMMTPTDVYVQAFNQISGMTPMTAKQEQAKFQQILNSGNISQIQNKLESLVMVGNNLSTEEKNKYNATKTLVEKLYGVKNIMDQFYAAGGETGLLKGKYENLVQKFGATGNPELAKLGIMLKDQLDEIRRQRSGAALTDFEEAFYDSIFPSNEKNYDLNQAAIDGLTMSRETMFQGYLRSMYTPDLYDAIRGGGGTSASSSATTSTNGGGVLSNLAGYSRVQ